MAKQIAGVYDAVLACAKAEFLDKGYQDASLRTIAQKAGTSTGSIYTRFGDKEGLFEAIVQPVVTGVMELYLDVQETFHGFDRETQRQQVHSYSSTGMVRMLDYMYAHSDEFRLLLDASHGTRFQNFVDDLTRLEVDYAYRFLEAAGWCGTGDRSEMENLMHIIWTGYFEAVFEVIRHGMDREAAGRYVHMLKHYHAAGFDALFCPDK